MIVPSKRTPLTPAEAIAFLHAAVLERGGGEELARMVAAQSDLETGTWKSIYNCNLGNIRGEYQGMTTSIPGATEYDETGKLVQVPAEFRAYPSFEAGADDKIAQLIRNWPKAWAADDLTEFVDGLWRGRLGSYFGVPPNDPYGPTGRIARDRYEAGVRARYRRLFGAPGAPADAPLRLDLPVIEKGSSGPMVRVWQKLLGAPVTGGFDDATDLATREWQQKNGLVDDGDVGPLTWGKMLA